MVEFRGQIVSEIHFNLLDPIFVFKAQLPELLLSESFIMTTGHFDLCLPDFLRPFILTVSFFSLSGFIVYLVIVQIFFGSQF